MGTRPRPPWWTARALARRHQLDLALERLRASLVKLEGFERALVFGSYARDDVGPESDLDLIVVRRSATPQVLRTFELYGELDIGVAYDAIVYTPEEFERLRETREFVRQAEAEGFWLSAT